MMDPLMFLGIFFGVYFSIGGIIGLFMLFLSKEPQDPVETMGACLLTGPALLLLAAIVAAFAAIIYVLRIPFVLVKSWRRRKAIH